MATKYIIGSCVASFAVAYVCDTVISDGKLFGGTTPSTVTNTEWWEETDKKFQAWPRTAGPPVVMNPISRQNYIWFNEVGLSITRSQVQFPIQTKHLDGLFSSVLALVDRAT
ncbi:hypothetical protein P3S68_030527 [Capsicum galapagoense]